MGATANRPTNRTARHEQPAEQGGRGALRGRKGGQGLFGKKAAERFPALRNRKKGLSLFSKRDETLKPLEVHQPASESDLIDRILNESTNVKAFGGGMASNVVRFYLKETSKGGNNQLVQSNQEVGSDQVDYVFYARMNMCSAKAYQETRNFCQQVVSHVVTGPNWDPKARLLIPRILLNVDRSDEERFMQLHDWMKQEHKRCGKDFHPADFFSITIVEGTTAEPLPDLMGEKASWPKDMTRHVLELALMHALDVAIGMGDRFQNPNPGNVTINPRTSQVVMIDVDTFLPPKGLGQAMEEVCVAKVTDPIAAGVGRVNNECWTKHHNAWPACPPRFPFQGEYMRGVERALSRDLELYWGQMDYWRNKAGTQGTYQGKKAHPMAYIAFNNYLKKLGSVQYTEHFFKAACHVLRIIRNRVCDGTFKLDVEDISCSGARLEERVKQWRF